MRLARRVVLAGLGLAALPRSALAQAALPDGAMSPALLHSLRTAMPPRCCAAPAGGNCTGRALAVTMRWAGSFRRRAICGITG